MCTKFVHVKDLGLKKAYGAIIFNGLKEAYVARLFPGAIKTKYEEDPDR